MHHLHTQKPATTEPHEIEKNWRASKFKFQNPQSGGGFSELMHEACML